MQAPHVQDADELPGVDERHAQQRDDALFAQERVQDVGVVHVGDEHGTADRRDAPGEPAADRDLHPALDLLL